MRETLGGKAPGRRPSFRRRRVLYPAGNPRRRAERKPMSQKAMQRLSFFLLMGLTLYAATMGAG
ncbi:MAG: hypothetical protein Q4615_11650 [Paracoccus aminovorans]|nr:hypothetical protein [Paracoccus aminovorans]